MTPADIPGAAQPIAYLTAGIAMAIVLTRESRRDKRDRRAKARAAERDREARR